jgi:hypothetical protein
MRRLAKPRRVTTARRVPQAAAWGREIVRRCLSSAPAYVRRPGCTEKPCLQGGEQS